MSEIELAFLITQLGLAFVFVWTGILIFMDMPSWTGIIEKSWVKNFVPSAHFAMQATAVFDIIVGAWLFSGIVLWIPALLAALHLVSVLLVTGIMGPSYRDVGLLAMAVALTLHSGQFV
jgi:uncharacterized membrane protein YphA (DoxX/SURF4 family)